MTIQINDLEITELVSELSDKELEGVVGGGLLDGSANNAHILTDISILNTNINSDSQYVENNNANTRTDGTLNNSISIG